MPRLLARLWALLVRPRHDWDWVRGCEECRRCGALRLGDDTVFAADGAEVTGTRDANLCP